MVKNYTKGKVIDLSGHIIDLTGDVIDLSGVGNGAIDESLAKYAAHLKIYEEEHLPAFDLVDLTDEDGLDGDDFFHELAKASETEIALARNLPFGHVFVDQEQCRGQSLSKGADVELHDGSFLRVHRIIRNLATGDASLQGLLMRRTRQVDDMLPKKLNELCFILNANIRKGAGHALNECMVSRPLSEVIRVRRIVIANQPFPSMSWRERTVHFKNDEDVEARGVLVCRWKYTAFSQNNKVTEYSLMRLREEECDPSCGKSDVLLFRKWQGDPKKLVQDGSRGSKRAHVDLTEDSDDDIVEEIVKPTVEQIRKRMRRSGLYEQRTTEVRTERCTPSAPTTPWSNNSIKIYTYGDICAGAGGMASGAVAAGLKIAFLLDHWEKAVQTLGRNHKHTRIFNIDIQDFCTEPIYRQYAVVAILHISFPCQPHSQLHTRDGPNDEQNVASGYSVIPILQMCKPRIVTLEQTSGIVTHRGGWHFRALVHQLTSIGYSVRWRIINCAELGNVQARKRLFIIAAAPGELLPPFPAPTHGIAGALRPFTTIRNVLARVPRVVEPHMARYTPRVAMPYSDRAVLKQAITGSGGESDLHPSGKRSFNMQELAQLQGFPAQHKFVDTGVTDVRKLIGNAVPSCVARAIFDEVVKSLKKSDETMTAWKPDFVDLE